MARLIGLGSLLAAAALFYAWQHFQYLQLRYQIESLKAQRSQFSELNQELKLEVAGLRAPSRIDEIARRQLRLTAPVPGQVAPLEGPFEPVVAQVRPSGQSDVIRSGANRSAEELISRDASFRYGNEFQ
jgi:cell division protein FtsL